jgi:hypothetical protein
VWPHFFLPMLPPSNAIYHVVTLTRSPHQVLVPCCLDFPATRIMSQMNLFSSYIIQIRYFVIPTQNGPIVSVIWTIFHIFICFWTQL